MRATSASAIGSVLGIALGLAACGGAEAERRPTSILQPDAPAAAPAPADAGATAPAATAAPAAPAAGERTEHGSKLAAEGLSAIRAGRLAEGRDRLLAATEASPGDGVAWYNLAVASLHLHENDLAEKYAYRAVEASRGSWKALRLLLALAKVRQHAEAAASFLQDQAERLPEVLPMRIALARARILQGRPADALREASDLLKKDEANIEIMKTIAMAYLAMERNEAATFVLGQALEVKKDAECYDMLGQMALRNGESAKAMAYFQQALGLDPRLADARNNLGVLYHLAGDHEAAIREFDAAVKSDPTHAGALMNLGTAWRKSLQFDKAIGFFKEALKLQPDCADCYFNLGVAELENKGPKDEPSHYRRAIQYLRTYREMHRGARRDDEADKYIDEATRMADLLEKEQGQMKQPEPTPPATPPPAPAGGGAQGFGKEGP